MKKLFLLLAFTGIVAASSATTITSFTKATITNIGGDDKKVGDDKKKKCDKEKACCKGKTEAGTSAKACSGEKQEGKCCKSKATAATTTSATEKK